MDNATPKATYRIGIDVGSTTAKLVVLDPDDHIILSRYQRHNAKVKELLLTYFAQLQSRIGSAPVALTVTGSVGMATAELLQARFIQEVVAAANFARHAHPQAKALIDIGGEDSKVILFEGGHTQLRMNGNCAGGTGAFIDQMASLLGRDHMQLNRMALQSTQLHTIAARCGVFAKTDVQNLISRNVPPNDIAASIMHSIAVQTISTLAHGCTIAPPILLCGGPLTFFSALRKAFAQILGISEEQFIVSDDSNLIPAKGCALSADTSHTYTLAELRALLSRPTTLKTTGSLQPLFDDEAHYTSWLHDKAANALTIHPMRPSEQVIIGIDSGSTTTKIIATRPSGDVLFCHYAASLGNPVGAVRQGLELLKEEATRQGCTLQVIGSCSTGYGEELIKTAFALDYGIVETIAHFHAARRLNPQVSFILDIGGQDMKAIFVEQGVVTRMELNEACSSGCGTFLQTFAENLGYKLENFVRLACRAHHPANLGSRCTVFMNSKVKQVLREGVEIADIAAGLAYSVVNNCLFKVLKLTDPKELGQHIVVQGGTMRNDAVVRALEVTTGCTVSRSSFPEMMGAYGCALHAANSTSTPRSIDDLLSAAVFTTTNSTCKGCENRCAITQYHFSRQQTTSDQQAPATFYSGNKCERIFHNGGAREHGENLYKMKYQRLFRIDEPQPAGRRRIGIPRALGLYEDFPFWSTLLARCGFEAILSSESTMPRYEAAVGSVMSDNICFPAKLTHSHIAELNSLGVERILFPYVVYEQRESEQYTNSYNCPIVSAYSDVVRSAMDLSVPIDAPVINFSNKELLRKQIHQYLQTLGVPTTLIDTALDAAMQAQAHYALDVKAEAQRIAALGQTGTPRRLTILLAGRPYHTDPLIQHRISDMIAALGVNVISEDIVRDAPQLSDGQTNSVRQWAYINRIIKAAQWVAEQGDDVQFVEMTSFGCGPDSFIQDEVRALLGRHKKSLTLLKIDDITNNSSLKLRVRSLVESLNGSPLRSEADAPRKEPFHSTPLFGSGDKRRTILAPFISEFISPLIPPILSHAGYHVETLPPSDETSAALGLKYANNEVCYPATLVVGDIIKALRSGRYDRTQIAVAMTQTGGQCRATNYAGLIKRAMVQAGYDDVPFLPVGVTTAAEASQTQGSMDIPWLKVAPMLLHALLFADTLSKLYYPAAAREREQGLAAHLRDRYLQEAVADMQQSRGKHFTDIIRRAARDFDSIALDKETVRVGIVGEIFLKFNHFANQFVVSQVMAQGMEVAPPLIAPFFLQEFVNMVYNKQAGLSDSRIPAFLINSLSSLSMRQMDKYNRAAAAFRYYRPMHRIEDTARRGCTLVSPAAQFGEGWLLPGDILDLAEEGVKNVVSLQPFGCIANHIVAKGIERQLARQHPDINLLNLDFDSGVSQVNVTNRLLLFLDRA